VTPDQQLALRQLADIADVDSTFVVGDVVENDGLVSVEISLATGAIARGPGIVLRARESFRLLIDPDFPYEHPTVLARHRRWAGTPHVQWGGLLCLYAAPAVEWNPSDGMFGLLDRLWHWLESAAAGELDPEAAPLHPPVIYDIDYDQPQIIVRANAPVSAGDVYVGAAIFDRPAELRGRADVVGFKSLVDVGATGWPDYWGLAIVMDGGFDWEYPTTVAALLDVLTARGLTRDLLIELLELGARELPADRPLVVLLGAPMRRIEGQRLLHFVAWAIPAEQVRYLRYRFLRAADDPELRKGGEAAEWLFDNWAGEAKLAWCRLREGRLEVTRPREDGSPLVVFAGKTVVVWGCGALGAPVAEALARVGPAKLVLYDNGIVAPGLLVRQPFADPDIGHSKATCLAARLRAALPGLDVEAHTTNVLRGPLARGDWSDGADVLIDATASTAVSAKLERVRAGAPAECFVVSAAFGHEATRGLVTVTPPAHPAGPRDLARKVKIRVRTKAWSSEVGYRAFADEFWPMEPHGKVFQPEPGCSEPTFRGSQAEVGALALSMLLWAGAQIARGGEEGHALLTALPTAEEQPEPRQVEFAFASDALLEDAIGGYQVRLAPSALAEIRAHMRRNDRALDPRFETGGLLFGERDDATRVIWVNEIAGPPPDSEGSAAEFICGVEGVDDIRDEKRRRGLGSLAFVGTWHTHPNLRPVPSDRDVAGMSGIVLSSEPLIPRALLLIVGGDADETELGAYLFDRADLRPPHVIRAHVVPTTPEPSPVSPRDVGLALSGGGFRALAFHLGCLRALNDRGVLERVFVVSGVSGGSLAAALYAYSDGDFAAFDQRVGELLRGGLQLKIARRAFASPRALKTLTSLASSGSAAAGARTLAAGDAILAHLPALDRQRRLITPPWRRFSSASEALIDVFAGLFPEQTLASARRDDVDLVLNACELRSGSAFRFGSRESHCYRYGAVVGDLPVALAVAASAAYPLLLPALDHRLRFRDRDGAEQERRIVLTDGGVFDNLGTSVLEPGRDPDITVTYDPAYVIACDAGRGLLDDGYVPYGFVSRMRRSFEATFRKAQDGARNRLHLYAASGELKGFVFPYLGQSDSALPLIPADLPRRAEVIDYPTDFAAMTEETIELLAGRGEKLTRLLVDFYCPEL
jgi:integrative and conjugative element protein (TIGR02256 family)